MKNSLDEGDQYLAVLCALCYAEASLVQSFLALSITLEAMF
jgi:hypothetical protein